MALTLASIGVACLVAGFFVFLFSQDKHEGRRMVQACIGSGVMLLGCLLYTISLTL